jgi:hypothetical protein
MKKIAIVLAMILLLAWTIPAVAIDGEIVEAQIVSNDIIYRTGYNFGKRSTYPLLSYNDHVYVAVRDLADALKVDIKWNEETGEIRLWQKPKEKCVIKNDETALAIGKAIIAEYFADKITDNTGYVVSYSGRISTGAQDYTVFAKFDTTDSDEADSYDEDVLIIVKSDVQVDINPTDGCIERILLRTDKGYVNQLK